MNNTIGVVKYYNTREFSRILVKNGYKCIRKNGDHFIFENANLKKKIIINKNLNKMVMRRLIKQYNLTLK